MSETTAEGSLIESGEQGSRYALASAAWQKYVLHGRGSWYRAPTKELSRPKIQEKDR